MSKPGRTQEIIRLREEGRQAALAGRAIEECPYKYMDAYQWRSGYLDAKQELEAKGDNNA